VRGVLRYLKGTIYFGIEYTNYLNVELTWFSYSDWVGDPNDRKSTIGYEINIGYGIVS
jgi:hypothetical protein